MPSQSNEDYVGDPATEIVAQPNALSCLAVWIAEHDGSTAKISMGDPSGWVVTLEADRLSTWGDGLSLSEAILDAIESAAVSGL
jgi:hypothetical protein